MTELHSLSRSDTLRVVQLLVNDLASEEEFLVDGAQYEVWSPYDSASVAETLLNMLAEDKR